MSIASPKNVVYAVYLAGAPGDIGAGVAAGMPGKGIPGGLGGGAATAVALGAPAAGAGGMGLAALCAGGGLWAASAGGHGGQFGSLGGATAGLGLELLFEGALVAAGACPYSAGSSTET